MRERWERIPRPTEPLALKRDEVGQSAAFRESPAARWLAMAALVMLLAGADADRTKSAQAWAAEAKAVPVSVRCGSADESELRFPSRAGAAAVRV